MLIVGTDNAIVESDLVGGRLSCPDCGSALGPWGRARWRVLRRREAELRWRGRCRSCRRTHVLLGDHSLVRRRDDADMIVWALVERARGSGYRWIATALGMRKVAETVRGWLRAFAKGAEVLRAHFTRWAYALDPDLGPIAAHGDPVGDAVEAIASQPAPRSSATARSRRRPGWAPTEGACRHLVKDRMDITGARWGLDGAEAVLKLRAVRTNGDFDTYWTFHLNPERQRTHASRYANHLIPAA